MRTLRLEFSAAAQKRYQITSSCAHFPFVTNGQTGFDMVRNVLRRRQGELLANHLSRSMLGRVVHDVSAMAFWRFIRRRLWIPREADLFLQVNAEQTPNRNSRLFLSLQRDINGRRRLAIDWRIQEDDIRIIRIVAERFASAWQKSSLAHIADLHLTMPRNLDAFETPYDVYHPIGTLRMGLTERDGVVDKNLRIWPIDNTYVSSTAVFPSEGSANPGLTQLALTARLAEHIVQKYFTQAYTTNPDNKDSQSVNF